MTPLVAMPPFPGAKAALLRAPDTAPLPDAALQRCLEALVARRVGGSFWGYQAVLQDEQIVLVESKIPGFQPRGVVLPVVAWPPTSHACDPWSMLDRVAQLWCDEVGELAILAYAKGIRVFRIPDGSPVPVAELRAAAARALGDTYIEPFSNSPIGTEEAVELLGFWRLLIDSNRNIGAAAGMAFWKRDNIAALLFNGSPLRFVSRARELAHVPQETRLAVWKSKTDPAILEAMSADRLIEVEDGFIRSSGLGADCVPPFSILVDAVGVHFDPSQPSRLEQLIETADHDPATVARAKRLIESIVENGVGKYGVGRERLTRQDGSKRHVLVTGQVEDDRSVLAGRGDVSGNLDLLQRARAREPQAFIIYRPHPDVEAGHRKGAIPDSIALRHANAVDRRSDIASLIELVDAVHVLTSLAGFEALLRGREVVTHGVPFYAGWGLTTDLGAVPARRTARPGLEEFVATVLLTYPRYLDPVTHLPCPPEILIERLISGNHPRTGVVTFGRRVSGRVSRLLNKAAAGA